GGLYARGEGVVGNLPDALLWYRRAAERGHAEAQFQLSLIYQHGHNGAAALGEGDRVAATQNKDAADAHLALLLPNGVSVERAEAEALRWGLAAAEQGHAAAQANTGHFYARGTARAVDYTEARRWYGLAAEPPANTGWVCCTPTVTA